MKKRKTAILMAVIAMLGVMGCEGGEKHEWGEWVTTKEATCTEKGEETRVCEKNGEHKEKRELAAKGHEWGEWETEKEAGCVMSGRERRVCKNDASHSETRSIEAKGHDSAWRKKTEAWCENKGIEELYCGRCKKVLETRSIEAKGHEWSEWATTKEATCTDKGEEKRVCKRDKSHSETRSIEAKGHEWSEWATTKEATCTDKGEEKRVCKRDKSHSETRSIEAKGHEWGEWKESKAPTLTEEGEETRVCKNDASHSETRKTEKLKKVTESIRIENGKEIEATENADKEIELKVMIKYERAEEKAAESSDVTYSSNNHETATVNSEGVITIKKAGEAEITVESVNGNAEGVRISERIKVTVKHARTEKLEVTSSKRYTLVRGIEDEKQGVTSEATAQIEVKIKYEGYEERAGGKEDVIYKSSNEEVASVDEEGKISFNGEGTATIKVESKYEKEGGGKMEESIAVQVNAPPENTTGLEVVSFETGIGEDNDPYLDYTIKNITDSYIEVLYVDVYYLDESGKILGSGHLGVESSFAPTRILPGQEITHGISGGINFPEETVKILIYNRRTA